MSSSPHKPFQKHEVEDYERKRYRHFDQKIVDRREKAILAVWLAEIGKSGSLPRTVLDVPCGYGRFSELLRLQGFEVWSSDLSFHMVEKALNKLCRSGQATGAVADAKSGLPFKDAVFRCVFSMRFFHHLHSAEERCAVLREFWRVSAGWVILSFYRINRLHRFQRRIRKKLKKKKREIKMISRAEFLQEIDKAGFRLIREVPLIPLLHAQRLVLLEKK